MTIRIIRRAVNIKTLVLLIGKNPLPNYIVGKYMKDFEKFDNLVLIHSEENKNIKQHGTKKFAESIEKALNYKSSHLVSLTNVGNAVEIRKDLLNKFPSISGKIHLNYTGGTKTMVIQAYKYLSEKYKSNFNASYLDTRSKKIIYDDGTQAPKKGILGEKVHINIKTLMDLHQYELIDYRDSYDSKFEKCLDLLETLPVSEYRELFKKISLFKKHISKMSVIDALNKINDNQFKNLILSFEFFNKNKNKIIGSIPFDFRNGIFFEQLIFRKLIREINARKLGSYTDAGLNLKGKNPSGQEFELDIVVIKGYILSGISITIYDDIKKTKMKGFEILRRTRQIGGIESKSIIISLITKERAERLQKDLALYGYSKDKIVFFSIDDIKDIGKKILDVL